MTSLKHICLIFGVWIAVCHAKHLPPYIKPCHKDDPKLNECALKVGNDVIPHIMPGYKPLQIPPLNPVVVPFLELDTGSSLKMKFLNIKGYGLDTGKVMSINIDLKKQHVDLNVHLKELRMSGEYEISGRILILPITGKGPGTLTFVEPDFYASADYDLENHKDGKEYARMKNGYLNYTIQQATYELTNLFNGDETLGGEMNKFLNENWREVSVELAPVIQETMKGIILNLFNMLANQVPFDELFL